MVFLERKSVKKNFYVSLKPLLFLAFHPVTISTFLIEESYEHMCSKKRDGYSSESSSAGRVAALYFENALLKRSDA